MILLHLLFSFELAAKIDSLKACIDQNPQLSAILELNEYYLRANRYSEGIALLEKYEEIFESDYKSYLIFNIGDNYFFAGKIIMARNEYLKLVSHYPRSEIANDALERLYLIESVRQDTVLLKKLAYSICLYTTNQLEKAEDSLKTLSSTKLGAYAYYYLALLYKKREELPLALSALNGLYESYPNHSINNAALLLASVYFQVNNKAEAKKILEDLILEKPRSIYAVRAQRLLEQYFK